MFLSTLETCIEFVYPGCWHFDNHVKSKKKPEICLGTSRGKTFLLLKDIGTIWLKDIGTILRLNRVQLG